jgi:hypothetical protein
MSIFLYQNTEVNRSYADYIVRLLRHLDNKWYPTQVIGSEVYDIESMYADQISSASAEVIQTYYDTSIQYVRDGALQGRYTSKMYDNFGISYEVNRYFTQDYNDYDSSYFIQSYRQQLRLLAYASTVGTTDEALMKVGQAFSGISPHIIHPIRDVVGWKLSTYRRTVVEQGTDYLILNEEIPHIGFIIYIVNAIDFAVGTNVAISWSKLGHNTKLISGVDLYSGVRLTFFIHSTLATDATYTDVIENATRNVLKSDLRPRFTFSEDCILDRPGYCSPVTPASGAVGGWGVFYSGRYYE